MTKYFSFEPDLVIKKSVLNFFTIGGLIIFFIPTITFADVTNNLDVPIASNGDIPAVSIGCTPGHAYTLVLPSSGDGYVSYNYGTKQRLYCNTGVITFDGFNLDTLLTTHIDPSWNSYVHVPLEYVVKDSTQEGDCSSVGSCAQYNLIGAWEGYRNGINAPSTTCYNTEYSENACTLAAGARFTTTPYTGVWSNSVDGDGSGNYHATTTVSSDVTSDTTWRASTVYTVSGDISIDTGVTLTIEPGTIIKFATTTSSSLTVNGTLDAIGADTTASSTQVNQIVFTSSNESASTTPSAGDWGGIIVNSGGIVNLGYTAIAYGGNATSSNALIYNNGGLVNISTSTINYSSTYGIKNSAGTTTITASDMSFNSYGLYLSGGSASITASSTIHDNSSYSIYNNTTNIIDAENNWWATSTGPYNLSGNPSGGGDTVSDYVNFTPWVSNLNYLLGIDSVDSGEIRWDGSTQYSDEWYNAIAAWNALGSINIATDTIFTITDLTVSDINDNSKVWVGLWTPHSGADTLEINEYYANDDTPNQIQEVITHELGHALGLGHSYIGNVMYFRQTSQITLGTQDIKDYYHLWP